MINKLVNKATENDLNIYSIAVMDGDGIHEAQLHPANQCSNTYSVSKLFTAMAIGMMWDEGKVSVDDKVVDILKDDLPNEFDSRWNDVTIEHLLTHKAGFGRGGLLDIDVDDVNAYGTDDYLKVVFSEPLPYEVGTHFVYTDAAFYLLSRIVTKVSGKRLDDYMRPVLFGKLSFRELAWSTCPRGYCMGATGLYLRTSDIVKLGFVYANNGSFFGEKVVSPEWVKLSVEREFGLSKYGDREIYAKGGMYGQMLIFSPLTHEAVAWRAFEPDKDVSVLFEVM